MSENVYIGSKSILNYVMALVTALQKDQKVNVMARGWAISSSVDVVEVCKRNFVIDICVDDILIGTERKGTGDDMRNVSIIHIKLSKPS
jgi:DNA-binding protein Alba